MPELHIGTVNSNTLMISVNTLKARLGTHGNVDEQLIRPDIKFCQDNYVVKLLGSGLYNKMIGLIEQGVADPSTGIYAEDNQAYKILLDKYLIDMLAYYTISESPLSISFQQWTTGVSTKVPDNTTAPDMSGLFTLMNKFKSRAAMYRDNAHKFLQENAEQYYPEYFQPGSGIDTILPRKKSYSCPIYLGLDTQRKDRKPHMPLGREMYSSLVPHCDGYYEYISN